ncbi:MAG: HAD family phosphatase [Atopobiaceae bacterium]|nr:HAD family phosphatase [Atopobiaceae bacterium]
MIRLIASDMDGTLLDEHSRVPSETFGFIQELREMGVQFSVSSGRRFNGLAELFGPVADMINYVASNGMEVYAGGEMIGREVISYDAICELAELTNRFDILHLCVSDGENVYICDDTHEKYVHHMEHRLKRFGSRVLEQPPQVFGLPGPRVDLMTGWFSCEDPSQLTDLAYVLTVELGHRFTFNYTQYAIDFTPAHISKATGLLKIMRHYGIKPSETVAYGDSMNDYEMLRYVGHPTVMGNALYGVEAIAERVIEPNSEHGVQKDMARILESLRAGGNGLD